MFKLIISIITKIHHKIITEGKYLCKLIKVLSKEVDILIVEDEIILAMAIELSLQEMDYNVSGIETTGQDAIEHAKIHHPDIVLMDINLKNSISGIEAATQIWKRFNIPIIFLTSYHDDKTMKETLECEPYGYLIKPCQDADLKVAITTALHKHKYFFENKSSLIDEENQFVQVSKTLIFNRTTGILYQDNKQIQLTKNEKKLFEIMTEKPGQIVPFHRISTFIWREPIYDMGKMRTLFYRLRLKIGTNPFENIYEEGYKLTTVESDV